MSATDPTPVRIEVRRGNPTAEELAAAVAVVAAAYRQEAEDAVAPEARRRSGWELSQRSLRRPLRRELGWGHFGG